MTLHEAIEVLQVIKRKEITANAKNKKLYTNPSESIGAKAIDEAIKCMGALAAETERANFAERAAILILEQFRNKCGWCRKVRDGSCKHNGNWDACNKHNFRVTLRQVKEDAMLLDELDADREHYKEMFEAVLRRGVTLENTVIDYAPCWACKHEEDCENNNSQGCCNGAFEYDVSRFATGGVVN